MWGRSAFEGASQGIGIKQALAFLAPDQWLGHAPSVRWGVLPADVGGVLVTLSMPVPTVAPPTRGRCVRRGHDCRRHPPHRLCGDDLLPQPVIRAVGGAGAFWCGGHSVQRQVIFFTWRIWRW